VTGTHDPYAGLAPFYDGMARDPAIHAFYVEWRRSLLDAVREHGLRVRVLVDLACGTGNSTIPWTRFRSWTVVGVDRSAAMLREARAKSASVRWYCQDVGRLRIPERADLVTCHFDALNHVLDAADLERVFANAARTLREGGLFQFDLNTAHMLRWLAGREKLFRVGPHVFVASNAYDAGTGVATFRQTWFVRRGSRYERRDIVVRERAYSDTDLRAMLRRAGLRLLKVTVQRRIGRAAIRKVYLAAKP
jgi:SAM-dependent methyltransferase